VAGGWRRLHNEGLNNFYAHQIQRSEMQIKLYLEDLKGGDHLEDQEIDGRVILE
jgi:hypothetical protein